MATPSESTQLRRALRLAAAAIFVATPIELALQSHFGGIQTLATVACALGLVAVVVHERRRVARILAGVAAAIGALGVFEHFEHNFDFAREIRPNSTVGEAFVEAITGASPALAPGILCLGAALIWAATVAADEAQVATK